MLKLDVDKELEGSIGLHEWTPLPASIANLPDSLAARFDPKTKYYSVKWKKY